MLLRTEFSLPANEEEKTPKHKHEITKDFVGKKEEDIENNSDSDSEYDMLFDKMPIITNKEDKSIEKKQKKAQYSRLDTEIVSNLIVFLFLLYIKLNENKFYFLICRFPINVYQV